MNKCDCFCHTEGFAGDIAQHHCCPTDKDRIATLEAEVERLQKDKCFCHELDAHQVPCTFCLGEQLQFKLTKAEAENEKFAELLGDRGIKLAKAVEALKEIGKDEHYCGESCFHPVIANKVLTELGEK